MTEARTLSSYRLLGRSGLRVSPMSLGTMTFGTDWGWGADEGEARRIFDAYVDHGGNFIDTANRYTEGTSERFIGAFAEARRHELVIATKYTLPSHRTDPNSGGNHRKSMVRSVEDSLRRLRTDYIDLLYLHAWDFTTPVDEILRAMDDLVRSGKVLYVGISDTPAWRVAQMQAIADLRGWSPLIALQIEYSLIERTGERDLIPMADAMGLGVIPWSPLASGVLTGKYTREDLNAGPGVAGAAGTRRNVAAASGALTERGLDISDVVKTIAAEIGCSPSQLALAWLLSRPGVASPLIGARTLAQLEDNLGALSVVIDAGQNERLDACSRPSLGFPHDFLQLPMTRDVMFGDTRLSSRREAPGSAVG